VTTTLSSKGQVVLPAVARKRLGLKSGTKFSCRVQGNQIVLTPAQQKLTRARFVRSKLTGMTVTAGPADGPIVTSEQVRALLAEFP
jgi:AbrB family looped-hinge helix DNA binding protein